MRARLAPEPPVFRGGGIERPLTIVRHARARRLRLSVDPRDGTVRLTLPPRAAIGPALAWIEDHRTWIETRLAKATPREAIGPGATIPFEGGSLTIDWQAAARRTVTRAGDRLIVGGPAEHVEARVLRWLRAEALARVEAATREIAGVAGVTVAKVAVVDAKARWGSCSADGDIRYSWRLILAPPPVLRATVAHEVAHRLHMDHSPAFHAAVAGLFGRSPGAETRWLRANGAALYRFGGG